MTGIAVNPINNYASTNVPYQYTAPVQQKQPAVAITTPQCRQVYNYPETSLYNDPNKKSASGVNIYVFNPSGIGGPNTVNNYGLGENSSSPGTPIANTSLLKETSEKTTPKTKNIVKLTDDYIKTEESFLRSQDVSIRKQAIQDLIKRFEEDDSRYDNAPLTALLNIALQDTDVHNRMLALSIVASGSAHGDVNTIELLKGLTTSDKMYGQEAKMASTALLKTSQTRETVEDNSPNSPQNTKEQENNINKMYE